MRAPISSRSASRCRKHSSASGRSLPRRASSCSIGCGPARVDPPATTLACMPVSRAAPRAGAAGRRSPREHAGARARARASPRTIAGVVLGALGIALSCGAVAYAAGSRRDEPCADAGATVDEVWNRATRDRIRAGFRTIDAQYAERAWRATDAGLDGYARRLIEMWSESCHASGTRQDPPLRAQRRERCLVDAAVPSNTRWLSSVMSTLV